MKTSIRAGINPEFLKLFREAQGLSQRDFAKKIETTAALVSRYETGLAEMSVDFLKKLNTGFGYSEAYFLRQFDASMAGLIHHRKRSTLSAKDKIRLEAEGRLRFMDVETVAAKALVRADVVERDGETPSELARKLREHWGVGSERFTSLIETLEEHGIFILAYDFGTSKIDGFYLSSADGAVVCIMVNSAFGSVPDRVNFSIGHELGHILMHRGEFPSDECEREANEFASAFLMPEESIAPELRSGVKSMSAMADLKGRWRVSISALLRRAMDLGVIHESRYRSLCVWMSAHGYRTKEPGCGLGEMERPRKFCECARKLKDSGVDVPNLLCQTREQLLRKYHKGDLRWKTEM